MFTDTHKTSRTATNMVLILIPTNTELVPEIKGQFFHCLEIGPGIDLWGKGQRGEDTEKGMNSCENSDFEKIQNEKSTVCGGCLVKYNLR